MSKHHRSDQGNDPAPSSSGSGSSAVPVQVTNVVQIIAEHVPGEYAALLAHIAKLREQTEAADRYKEQLERIASDAGVTLSSQP